jgi:predicted amidohydrolase
MKDLKVAVFQMEIITANKKTNLTKLRDMITKYQNERIDLWVVPELFTTGFDYDKFPILAEDPENSQTINDLLSLSKEFSVGIAGSYLTKENSDYYNCGFIISPSKGLIYKYLKIHLWGAEKEHFTPGNEVPPPIDFEGKAKIGLSICYDLRFPEVSRSLTKQGAEILITTAAWPAQRIHHFNLLAEARALENTCYHIAVSRIGIEKTNVEVTYAGSSRIINPMGEVMSSAKEKDQVLIVNLSEEKLNKTREYIPVLKDRKL